MKQNWHEKLEMFLCVRLLHCVHCIHFTMKVMSLGGLAVWATLFLFTQNPGTDRCGCEELFRSVNFCTTTRHKSEPTFCCSIGLELYGCKSPPIMLKGVLNKVVSSVITFIVEFCSSLEICCVLQKEVL